MNYRVSGICFVPNEAAMTVEANSPDEAMQIAIKRFKDKPWSFIVSNSQDEGAAFAWVPYVEQSEDGK